MKKKLLTNNFNQLYASILIDILLSKNIDHFYTSPGMRNVPLLSSLMNRKDELNINSAIDERGSSYRALGYAKVAKKASVLICTSGTALANYLPAIIEAKKTQTPLIIVSADRPFSLRHSGANQTINQIDIFKPYIDQTLQIDVSQNFTSIEDYSSIVNHYIEKTFSTNNNIIHINMAFNEPLDDTRQNISRDILTKAYTLDYSTTINDENLISPQAINKIKDTLDLGHTLVVFGNLPYTESKEHYKKFISTITKKGHLVYCDITSSLKYLTTIENGLIPSLDHPEVASILENANIKSIIHFGNAVTSKHYYNFIKDHPEIKLLTIHNSTDLLDPSLSQKIHINTNPHSFIKVFNHEVTQLNSHNKNYDIQIAYHNLIKQKGELIETAKLSYPVITKQIMQNIKDDSHIFIANSTFIRSFDSFSNTSKEIKNIHIHSNRGASGIEGLIATTVGISDALNTSIDLYIGDISFLHDLNSLSLLKSHKEKINIFICNNQSGGIFTLLPIAKDKAILPMITTPHSLSFKHAAMLFEIDYHLIETKDDYIKLDSSKFTNNINIIEILVSNEDNTKIYNLLKTVKLS